MNSLSGFNSKIDFLLTDIDDTLTDAGQLRPLAYESMWKLADSGVRVIPITGRPAGWCELIARQWPVAGIVGENGGFYFRYHEKEMRRHYAVPEQERKKNRLTLNAIADEILREVPGAAIASDQFCRILDLAVDFCEDVKALPASEVQKIVQIFKQHGAQAKISSIHVNGWFGNYDKLSETKIFLEREFALSEDDFKTRCAFVGDSPNDEPMWAFFPQSFAVANIAKFWDALKFRPNFVASKPGGQGFAEIASRILANLK